MRVFNLKVFDQIVSGTTDVWYSPEEHELALGGCRQYALQAVTTGVQGTSPHVVVLPMHSCDSENWITTGDTFDFGVVAENGAYAESSTFAPLWLPLGVRLKFQISLTGVSPRCRLKLYCTGHSIAYS